MSSTLGELISGTTTECSESETKIVSCTSTSLGKLGRAKSTLLERMALQDLERGNGFAVIDPHGDLVSRIAMRIRAVDQERVDRLEPSLACASRLGSSIWPTRWFGAAHSSPLDPPVESLTTAPTLAC